jgi:hypothetical protein
MRYYFSWTIERGEETFEIEIEGSYRFGSPATWTDPADLDEFEIYSISFLEDQLPFQLTKKEEQKIYDWVYENPPEEDYPDDYGD